jgi:Na+-transporting NADH:ubiquinone oxidoreductase subunit C
MQQHSNAYIMGFAAVVCLACSIVVSSSAVALRPRQDLNKELDRQKQVLTVAGLIEPGQQVGATQVKQLFDENIVAKVVELSTGVIDESADPSSFDQRKATKDPATSRPAGPNNAGLLRVPDQAVVYERVDDGNVTMYILPIEGKGLWKALWPGRKAFNDQGEIAIEVIKGHAGPPAQDPYEVDGLSGATLTSRGVSHLVRFWLSDDGFGPFLDKVRAEQGGA